MAIDWALYEKRIKINGNSIRERQINLTKDAILNDFQSSPSYTEVYFNDDITTTGVQIIDEDDYNFKKVLMLPGHSIIAGDLINFNNNNWLCIKVDKTNPVYEYGIIQKANNTLNVYQNHFLYEIPCVVDSNVRLYSMGYDDNKYLSIPDSNIIVRIPNTNITNNIKRDEIYELSGDNYKVVDINRVIEDGIIVLKMEYSPEAQQSHTYTLSILNGSTIDLQQSTTLQLNVNAYDNDTLISPTPSLTFTSSDETICTVDSSGLVTALDVIDSCVITVKLTSDLTVLDTININVIEVPQDNFTYTLTSTSQPDTEIIKGYSKTYTASKYNNGTLVPDAVFTFIVIPGTTPISAYDLTTVDSDECSITATSSGTTIYYITLRATDNSNSEFVEKIIKLKNLF